MTTSLGELSRSVLIIEPDQKFLDSLKTDPKTALLTPYPVSTVQNAQNALADKTNRFIAVVMNPRIDQPNGLSIIRYARVNRPATPIYIIHEEEPPFAEKEQEFLGIQAVLKKPVTYSQIVDSIAPNVMPFSHKEAKPEITVNLDQEFTSEDANFIGIRAEDFLAGTKSIFDLFVKLSSGRYIKILQSGESFDPERLLSYLRKGVMYFYLEKSSQLRYLDYCDKLASALIKSSHFSTDMKVKGTLMHGEETMKFLKSQGLNAGTIQFAHNFVKNVESLIRVTRLNRDEKIALFLNDFSKYDHAVSVTLVASLLAKALQFDGERAVKIIGLATLLHDIGLVGLPDECQDEDESLFSPEVLREYRNHPIVGSQALAHLGVDPIVIQAVAQHHERRTRVGFPAQLGAGSINKVAEIIGISDEFIRIVKKWKSNPLVQVYSEMKTNVFQHFSYDIAEGFRLIFFPTTSGS